MVRPNNPAVYVTLLITIMTIQVRVFAQSSSVATLERPIKAPQPVSLDNSGAVTAAKLVAEGLRIEEPATADSRRKAIEKYQQAFHSGRQRQTSPRKPKPSL